MTKLYWSVLILQGYTLFLARDDSGLCFWDCLNNPHFIKNFVIWMTNSKKIFKLEQNSEYINEYLNQFRKIFNKNNI